MRREAQISMMLAVLACVLATLPATGQHRVEPEPPLSRPDTRPTDTKKPVKVFILTVQNDVWYVQVTAGQRQNWLARDWP